MSKWKSHLALIAATFAFLLYIQMNLQGLADVQGHFLRTQQLLVRRWLGINHCFVSATHRDIQFFGRWVLDLTNPSYQAGFPGARLQFAVENSTSLYIEIGKEFQGAVTVSVLISVGEETRLFRHNAQGVLRISESLEESKTYNVELKYMGHDLPKNGNTLHFGGIWLDKHGKLITSSVCTDTLLDPGNASADSPQWKGHVVEVAQQNSPFAHGKDTFEAKSSHYYDYTELLEHSTLFNITTVMLPIPPELCLTNKCRSNPSHQPRSPTIPDLYFRSGPASTRLYHQPWTWSLSSNPPSTLILDIGLTDFHTVLTSEEQSNQDNNQALQTFTTHFVAAYVNFIQTIRRTTWHQRTPNQDMTYSYDSAPSDLTVFVMVPVLPPTHDLSLSVALHNALHQVTAQLRNIEGDRNTILMDTTGWLDDEDFTLPSHDLSRQLPIPNVNGHRKIAHFLSLHLCSYVAIDPRVCPFDRHDEYRGNLYVPDEVEVGRVVQEQKIKRVKAMLGFE